MARLPGVDGLDMAGPGETSRGSVESHGLGVGESLWGQEDEEEEEYEEDEEVEEEEEVSSKFDGNEYKSGPGLSLSCLV